MSGPTHHDAVQDHHWTTTNVGEAIPGVQTPLSWTVWQPVGAALREVGWAIGALTRAERADVAGLMEVFYGRAAFRLDPFVLLGDRLPGTTGPEVVESLLGRVPDALSSRPTNRRLPVIAWRFPVTFVRTPRALRRSAPAIDAWYSARLAATPALGHHAAVQMLLEAQQRLVAMVTLQTITGLAVVQPLHDALDRLVSRAGIGDVGVLSGGGGAELSGLVGDIWQASRGRLAVADVAARHGFHGPLEGELSSRVWREDPAPLERMVAEYASRPDSEDPALRRARRETEARAMRAELLGRLPAWERPLSRALLTLAARNIPLRGVAKRFLLQAFDLARAAARRLGELLVEEERIALAGDVFYLTVAELTGAWPTLAPELIAARRAEREAFRQLVLPSDWRGVPRVEPAGVMRDPDTVITGVGVSTGIVEGRARVVLDPATDEIEPDEILVAPTTDPSWASVMFISAGLVVDIGGALSHAAVVARELGIPCIVNTRDGTRRIQTGDRLRIDGASGRVEILDRHCAEVARTPPRDLDRSRP